MPQRVRYPTGPFLPRRNQRLPGRAYEEAGTFCFFTIRAYGREKPFTDAVRNATVMKTLIEDRLRRGVLVLAYCLMPDHLHLLLTPHVHGRSMLSFVDQFKGKSTNRTWQTGWSGKLWQPRNHDHVLRADEEFRAVATYILENQTWQGKAGGPEDYRWSGGFDHYAVWHVGVAYADWREWREATEEPVSPGERA